MFRVCNRPRSSFISGDGKISWWTLRWKDSSFESNYNFGSEWKLLGLEISRGGIETKEVRFLGFVILVLIVCMLILNCGCVQVRSLKWEEEKFKRSAKLQQSVQSWFCFIQNLRVFERFSSVC